MQSLISQLSTIRKEAVLIQLDDSKTIKERSVAKTINHFCNHLAISLK